jgi:hypothetical protein
MQVTKRDVETILKRLEITKVKRKHHRAGFLVVDGVKILKIHYSQAAGNMPTTVAHLFRKSLKLSVPEFQQLAGCRLNREAYVERLREQGVVPLRPKSR